MTQAAAKRPYTGAGAHLDRPDAQERESYSISDLTAEFDCTARALRFYEDEGLLLRELRKAHARHETG